MGSDAAEPPEHFTTDERRAMLGAAAVAVTLPDGGVRVEKAGIVGTGPTAEAASLDWLQKLAEVVARPKPRHPETNNPAG